MATHSSILAWPHRQRNLVSYSTRGCKQSDTTEWLSTYTDKRKKYSFIYSASNAGDPGSIPGSGRSPGEGNGNPLQYFCLENSMDRGAWWARVPGIANMTEWMSMYTRMQVWGQWFQGFRTSKVLRTWEDRDFPGGLVAKTPRSQCRGPGFDPWYGTRPHRQQLKQIPYAAWSSQINKC